MSNPFKYGGLVGKTAFCNRKQELAERRFLSGLVQAERGAEVFGSSFIEQNNLKSASSAQRVVENLLDRDVIDREEGSYFIADRFFYLWVKGRVG